MRIYLGADHRGFEQKNHIKNWLQSRNYEYYDLGADSLIPEDDYNDYAVMVAKSVLENPGSFGVLLCGSANGVAMQANRFKGIRAALIHSREEAETTRQHNNANIICLPSDQYIGDHTDILDTFISTAFLEYDRYIRRNKKLDEDPSQWQ
jgi:ribose 5-phosphate isomerase B